MLQNTRTQTHKSPLIQQNQPKSNTNSIQGTQKQAQEHKPRFKHKHNISNTIAQIQAQIQKIQNQNSNPNQDIDTNIARISTSLKIFSIKKQT